MQSVEESSNLAVVTPLRKSLYKARLRGCKVWHRLTGVLRPFQICAPLWAAQHCSWRSSCSPLAHRDPRPQLLRCACWTRLTRSGTWTACSQELVHSQLCTPSGPGGTECAEAGKASAAVSSGVHWVQGMQNQ